MNYTYEERMGKDKMLPLIMKMALPAVAAQLVNLLYSLVDRMYIGRIPKIGTDALAGIGITSSVLILISAFASVVNGGAAPLAAIALGREDRDRAERILGNGFSLLILFTIITTVFTYGFMEPMLRLSGASNSTLGYAKDYLGIYLIGTLFVMIATGLNTFISCQGRPGIAMSSVIIGATVNIILDPILIFGLNMGVKGAAVATIVAQLCSAIWVLAFLLSKKASLRITFKSMKPNLRVIGQIFALGISPFVMASTESLIGFVLNRGLSVYGDIYVSALTIMQSAMQIVSVPLSGFAQGFVPIISYNYGHGNKERVREAYRISLAVMFSVNFIAIIIMMIFPGFIATMFTKDIVLISTVKKVMPLFLAGMTIFGLQRTCQNTFVALGQAKVSLFIALLRKVLLLVPLALILPHFFGVNGIYGAEAIADGVAAIICTVIFVFQFPKILGKEPAVKKRVN